MEKYKCCYFGGGFASPKPELQSGLLGSICQTGRLVSLGSFTDCVLWNLSGTLNKKCIRLVI